MKALITGASSGIGKDLALELSKLGYDLILVARSKDKLQKLAKECKTKVEVVSLDLSTVENCKKLFSMHKNVDILINNAGYGLYGEFFKTDLEKELNMIDLNVKAVHVLTKLYLKEMIKKDSGRILNVASVAAFLPGPLMSTYYSTKSYVFNFTAAINKELKKKHSNVKLSVLCPGPVNTNFNRVAHGSFTIKGASSEYVAKYAIDKMFKNKLLIVPKFSIKLAIFLTRFVPTKLILPIVYHIQYRKERNY